LLSDRGNSEFVPVLPVAKDRNTVLYYSRNDTVYDISSDIGRKIPLCHAYMGKDAEKIKNMLALKNGEEAARISFEAFREGKMKFIRGFFCNAQYFAVDYMEFNPDNKQQNLPGTGFYNRNVFYDRKTKKSYTTKHINFDIFNSVKISKINLIGCFDDYFYAIVNTMFSAEDIQKIIKSNYLDDTVKDALLNMDDMSNPVIMVFK
jgi:hypothetical protein